MDALESGSAEIRKEIPVDVTFPEAERPVLANLLGWSVTLGLGLLYMWQMAQGEPKALEEGLRLLLRLFGNDDRLLPALAGVFGPYLMAGVGALNVGFYFSDSKAWAESDVALQAKIEASEKQLNIGNWRSVTSVVRVGGRTRIFFDNGGAPDMWELLSHKVHCIPGCDERAFRIKTGYYTPNVDDRPLNLALSDLELEIGDSIMLTQLPRSTARALNGLINEDALELNPVRELRRIVSQMNAGQLELGPAQIAAIERAATAAKARVADDPDQVEILNRVIARLSTMQADQTQLELQEIDREVGRLLAVPAARTEAGIVPSL